MKTVVRPRAELALAALAKVGVALLPRAVAPDLIGRLAAIAEERYREVAAIIGRQGINALADHLSPGQKYVSSASSLSLGAAFSGAHLDLIFQIVESTVLLQVSERMLGGAAACDLDQAWVRRQYPPHRSPSGHYPHHWHQDGALGVDFGAAPGTEPSSDALLTMVTCWIPFAACGKHAPGLEIVTHMVDRLLPVTELVDQSLRARFPAEYFWQPELVPGDVLMFLGGTVHRTHVTPGMSDDRTSMELRFFPVDNLPRRLAGDRFVRLCARDAQTQPGE